jgi:hypothetical protein
MGHKNLSPKSATVAVTFKAVASSFFGVRGSKAHQGDGAKLNPVHVILAGLVLAALFVVSLVLVVQWVVK